MDLKKMQIFIDADAVDYKLMEKSKEGAQSGTL